jgi:hypothetical protein
MSTEAVGKEARKQKFLLRGSGILSALGSVGVFNGAVAQYVRESAATNDHVLSHAEHVYTVASSYAIAPSFVGVMAGIAGVITFSETEEQARAIYEYRTQPTSSPSPVANTAQRA